MGDAMRRLGRPILTCAAWGAALLVILLLSFNCRQVPDFPDRAESVRVTKDNGRILIYDRDGDGETDYQQVLNRRGRKVELRFASKNEDRQEIVRIDQLLPNEVPHFIIALDGVPYELVEQSYQEGFFRLFYPPSRMISTFPSMTDLAFWKIFGGEQPVAYQAKHFDPDKNRVISGDDLYLSGKMADWAKKLDYRCSFRMDAFAYVMPQQIFEHELRGIRETFSKTTKDQVIVYSVATAGLGTQGGREAILRYLRQIDRFCEEIVYERRGRVKITLLADHGHNMSGRGRLSFTKRLEQAGFRVRDSIEEFRDVVAIKYGLVTYASFYTHQPAAVAHVLMQDPATTIACYPQQDAVIVQTIDGRAKVFHKNGRYRYRSEIGDPLLLLPILTKFQSQGMIDEDGYIEDRALFDATVTHEYPDSLHRIWQAFHGLVKKPADLIVCLRDGWVHGSRFFYTMIGGATSTHGSLNQLNSTTFVITMLGDLPPALRPEEVMPALDALRMNQK
jgi:hypothetical protein